MNVYSSLVLSVVVQALLGIFDVIVLLLKVPSKIYILKQLLIVEVVVQFIEGAFYLNWLCNFKNISNITPKRYIDWVITTPTMLITLICYLIFLQYKDKNMSDQLELFSLIKENFNSIMNIFWLYKRNQFDTYHCRRFIRVHSVCTILLYDLYKIRNS
jgi:bacteriorhodopsin